MNIINDIIAQPPRALRPWAIWIWNKDIRKEDILGQLGQFADRGFGGIAIRPGRDMRPAYLSEEFLALLEGVLKGAKGLGIGVRLADDFCLPWSGFYEELAGEDPECRAQELVLDRSYTLSANETLDFDVDDPESTIVFAARISNDRISLASACQIQVGATKTATSWHAPQGEWRVAVLKKKWRLDPAGYYLPNVFNAKVAQAYMRSVLDVVRSTYSRYVPSVLQGFVVEMPALLPGENSIPWDDDLIIKYRSRYKKDLLKLLPALFFDVDDCDARSRGHVYSFVVQAMYDRFPAVLETWAKKARMSQWVLGPERDIARSHNTLRDVFGAPTASLGTVGIQNQEGTRKSQLSLRAMADANAMEFKRETIGVAGRNRACAGATIQELKSEVDQLALAGAGKILIDGCYLNLDRRDHVRSPYSPSWYHPDWDSMGALCDYAARFTALTRSIEMTRPVALLFPSASIMADFPLAGGHVLSREISVLHKAMDELQSHNIGFDIISEHTLLSCSIKSTGEFGVSSRTRNTVYQTLVVPYSRLISNSIFVFLEKLANGKGSIFFLHEAPEGSLDGGQSANFTERVKRLVGPRKIGVRVAPVNGLGAKLRDLATVSVVPAKGKLTRDIHITHGTGQGFNAYFLENTTDRRDMFCTLELPAANHYYMLDLGSGEVVELEVLAKDGKLCKIGLDVSPRQTAIVVAGSTKIATTVPATTSSGKSRSKTKRPVGTLERSYRIVLKDRWSFVPDSYNALPLASWNTRIGLSRDSGGFSHYYEGYFEAEVIPATCDILFADLSGVLIGGAIEVSVNGSVIEPHTAVDEEAHGMATSMQGSLESGAGLRYDIRHALIRGLNRIAVRTVGRCHDPATIVYPPLILGDFSIKKGAKGWTIDSPQTEVRYGSWTLHGFPYLSGCGTYEQPFEVPSDYQRVALRFSQVSGSVDVRVNEVHLGMLHWQPLLYDITNVVEPRRNHLSVKVANTFDNLLRMNGRASGLIGEVYLDAY